MVTSATSYVICQITPFLCVGHTPAVIKTIVTKLCYLRGWGWNGNHSYHTNCSQFSMHSWQSKFL